MKEYDFTLQYTIDSYDMKIDTKHRHSMQTGKVEYIAFTVI